MSIGFRPFLASVLAFSCLSLGAAQAETVLKIVPHADLKNIDPIWTTAYITRNHGYLVYDTLFSLNDKLEPQPQMVESWKVSEDKLTWTFTLREGLKFHDGAPVKAEDAVASIQRWGKRDGMGQKLMEATGALDAVDDRTFTLKLSAPFGLVLDAIGKISANVLFVMPKRLAETDAFKQVPEIIGSGPYKFVKEEWVPGSKTVYVKNPDYVPRKEPPNLASGGKVAKVDRIEWHYIPDPNTAMNALISGEVDYFENPPIDLVPILKKAPNIKVEVLDNLGNQGIVRINHLHPPFDKLPARHAMMALVDQKEYMQTGIGDPEFWDTCYSFYACKASVGTDVGADSLKQGKNIERAKQLFKEAGYAGEPIVVLQASDIGILNASALVTAQNLRAAGLNVQLQAMDWSTVTSRRTVKDPPAKGGWNLFFTWTIGADLLTPLATNMLTGCDKAWFGWPCDAKTGELQSAYARETDPAKQMEVAKQIQARNYAEIVSHVPIGVWFNPVAYRSNLTGLIKSPVPFFWNVAKN